MSYIALFLRLIEAPPSQRVTHQIHARPQSTMLFARSAKSLIARRYFSHDAGRVLTQLHIGGMKPLTKPGPEVGLKVRDNQTAGGAMCHIRCIAE